MQDMSNVQVFCNLFVVLLLDDILIVFVFPRNYGTTVSLLKVQFCDAVLNVTVLLQQCFDCFGIAYIL